MIDQIVKMIDESAKVYFFYLFQLKNDECSYLKLSINISNRTKCVEFFSIL